METFVPNHLITKLIVLFTLGLFSLTSSLPLKTNTSASAFRSDRRCGQKFKAPNGKPAECPPDSPCCSHSLWCGNTKKHCDCGKCVNFAPKVIEQEIVTKSPLDQLTELLEAVSGPVVDDLGDIDPISHQHQPALELSEEVKSDQHSKRQLPALLGSALPFLTNFGAGLIKNALTQVVNRPDPISYTQGILKNFIPRALSSSSLKNSAVSNSIQTQVRNHNFNSAIATIDSNSHPLKPESHISNKYHKVLTENTNDRKLVNSVRHVLKALTSTIDSIMSQRLTSLSNLLTSLFTSIVESLRLLLIKYHDGHSRDLKKLLISSNNTLAEIKRAKPHTHVSIYALLSAILVVLVLIFPTLIVLRSSITNHQTKVSYPKYNRNEIDEARALKRKERLSCPAPEHDEEGFEAHSAPGKTGFKQTFKVKDHRGRFTQVRSVAV